MNAIQQHQLFSPPSTVSMPAHSRVELPIFGAAKKGDLETLNFLIEVSRFDFTTKDLDDKNLLEVVHGKNREGHARAILQAYPEIYAASSPETQARWSALHDEILSEQALTKPCRY